jgi:hypothetical protein
MSYNNLDPENRISTVANADPSKYCVTKSQTAGTREDIGLADLHDFLKRVQGFSYYFCFMIRIREAQKQTDPTEDVD